MISYGSINSAKIGCSLYGLHKHIMRLQDPNSEIQISEIQISEIQTVKFNNESAVHNKNQRNLLFQSSS
jgi:hypothetical protein